MERAVNLMKPLLVAIVMLSVGMSGCFEEKVERWVNKETYDFKGIYKNEYNDDRISFHDAKVTIQSGSQSMTVPFRVDGSFIHIRVRNSSKEKRPDIIMRIYAEGELLICTACAMYDLSNVWIRHDSKLSWPYFKKKLDQTDE
jgi:hypothetical protein